MSSEGIDEKVFAACMCDTSYRCRNFREGYIFAKNVNMHICDVKISRLELDLSTPENDRVLSPFSRVFYFHEISHSRK